MSYEKLRKLVLESVLKEDIIIGLTLLKEKGMLLEFAQTIPTDTRLQWSERAFWVEIPGGGILDFVGPQISYYDEEEEISQLRKDFKDEQLIL